ncbi:MAG: hypothetical protein JWR70_1659 [Modestobacter sp.]|jgi:hypothetical protein|nr:hypothetical protein [Modestobacter sp.]
MRFSELVGVTSVDADWFDPVLTEDTPLYIDPFLVFDDTDPSFAGAHDLVTQAGGRRPCADRRRPRTVWSGAFVVPARSRRLLHDLQVPAAEGAEAT